MFLTKVEIPVKTAANLYQTHKALWQLFPDQPPGTPSPFLYRPLGNASGGRVTLLMQSSIVPEKRGGGSVMVMQQREFHPTLQPLGIYNFLLRANPIRTIRDEKGRKNSRDKVKSCRVPLIREDQQLAWLERKLEPAATLVECVIESSETLSFRKPGQKPGHTGKLVVTTYRGILKANQPDTLVALMTQGVGPAKSFGCGLISLART